MRRRRASAPTFGLSLLDLLSCAFAGVIVLAVVMSALMGSSRVIEERSFLILDVTVSAPEEPAASPERRTAIDQLVLGLQLEGPNLKGIWRGERAELPIRDSGVTTTVLSGDTDGQPGRRHLTVVVRGLEPGEYRATLDVAEIEEGGDWASYRNEIQDRDLRVEIEVHHPGAQARSISGQPKVAWDGVLWQDDHLMIDLDG